MHRRKVLFLIPTLGGGGAERVLVNLVNNLDKNKYDVTVQTLFIAGTNAQYLQSDVHFIEGKIKQFHGNIHVMKLFSPTWLYRFFIKRHYDIVVSYLEGPTARIVSGCPNQNVKKVCWIHSQEVHTRSFRSRKECIRCYNKFDQIACVANSVKEFFLSLFPISSKCDVIYNALEDQIIRKSGFENTGDFKFSEQINIITVGRNVREKAFDRLVQIHKRILDEGVLHHMYHVGGGDVEGLQKLVKKLKVENTFHLLGFQSNPYKYVSKADLFVCSSTVEGFSSVVAEALILGVPVVSTNVSGAKELLGEHNEFGIVTDNEEEALYKGVLTMLSDADIRSHYKLQAQKRGLQFSKKEAVKSVEDMLDSL